MHPRPMLLCPEGEIPMPKVLSPAQIEAFERDGFVTPVRAMSDQRALYYRNKLESF